MAGGAWCSSRHDRRGLVSNQDRHEPFDRDRPHSSVTVCDEAACIAKAQRYVAGNTNETAIYQPDDVGQP